MKFKSLNVLLALGIVAVTATASAATMFVISKQPVSYSDTSGLIKTNKQVNRILGEEIVTSEPTQPTTNSTIITPTKNSTAPASVPPTVKKVAPKPKATPVQIPNEEIDPAIKIELCKSSATSIKTEAQQACATEATKLANEAILKASLSYEQAVAYCDERARLFGTPETRTNLWADCMSVSKAAKDKITNEYLKTVEPCAEKAYKAEYESCLIR